VKARDQILWKTVCCVTASEESDQWRLIWISWMNSYSTYYLSSWQKKKHLKQTFSSSFDISCIDVENMVAPGLERHSVKVKIVVVVS